MRIKMYYEEVTLDMHNSLWSLTLIGVDDV
jgi:hypothetical protein